ncbi:MAG: endo-1,4-beta-xylanase [Staphylococcus sp.]|nr:endo-1,4-beta-xylanase [Staphylococcus sp.]
MKFQLLLSSVALMAAACSSAPKAEPTLKDYFADDFIIGAAINVDHVNGLDTKADSIVKRHFNSIVAENCMKSEEINPAEGVYNWEDADKFVDYGLKNNMAVIGHTLVWHSQLAPWFPLDSAGNYVTPEVLKERMRNHITTMMTRYKGKVKGWDVVNEAIEGDGSYRKSPFYEILGEEYIPLAFQYAHEADPDAELYINDYGMNMPAKREAYVRLVNDMKAKGLRIDAIGMQGHMGMDYPDFKEFEESIEAFASTGCNVMITEWDMSALPTVSHSANVSDSVVYNTLFNPYPDGLPAEIADEWNNRMDSVLDMLLRHKDVITRVTAWGTQDGMSWKNDYPMRGRVEYPLLFDRNYQLKPFMAKRLATESENKK